MRGAGVRGRVRARGRGRAGGRVKVAGVAAMRVYGDLGRSREI